MLANGLTNYRPPAVAGHFYPEDPLELTHLLNDVMQQAQPVPTTQVKALIVPHAGIIYSGAIAASAYQTLQQQAAEITRVVLLGPSHRVGFHGIASTSSSAFSMPFGDVPVDRDALNSIQGLPQVTELDQAHQSEHSLEVQLPFLQTVLQQFMLVPLVVGECPQNQVAEVLNTLWGGKETLIVISSDLSHFNSYEVAQQQDRETSKAILQLAPEKIHFDDACGRNPVNGLLVAAQQHNLQVKLLDLRNSGDTAGSKDRVVGYGSYLFSELN